MLTDFKDTLSLLILLLIGCSRNRIKSSPGGLRHLALDGTFIAELILAKKTI